MSIASDVKIELPTAVKKDKGDVVLKPSGKETSSLLNSVGPAEPEVKQANKNAFSSFFVNTLNIGQKAYNDPEVVEAQFADEPLYFHFLRWLAHVAGVATPLGKQDYDAALAKYKTPERIRTEYVTDVQLQCQRMLNQPEDRLPFDWYDIVKESKLWFCGVLLLLYFLVLCSIFGAIGEYCFVETAPPGTFFSRAFLLLSGMTQYDNEVAVCSWSNAAAAFFGLYISLPLFGAVLLVRLLAPLGAPPQLSNNMLLNITNGYPVLSIQLNNPTGRVVTNVDASIMFSVMFEDKVTGKKRGKSYDLKLEPYCKFTSGNSNLIYHVVDETSPLHESNHGIVKWDEDGIPRVDNKRIGVVIVTASFDTEWGGRKLYTMRMYYNTGAYIVEGKLNEAGVRTMPAWESVMLIMMVKWRVTEGRCIPSADNTRLHQYRFDEYKTKEELAKEEAEKEAKEAAEKARDDGGVWRQVDG